MRARQIAISIASFALAAAIVSCLFALTRRITRDLNLVTDRLDTVSRELNEFKEGIVRDSVELASSAQNQQGAVQATVAAMSEMSSMIARTTQSTKDAEKLAREVSDRTEVGKVTMSRMMSSIESIQVANTELQTMADVIQQISAKTAVINDIVFKTQLLSFNASIEAARAGAHGRGFSVVAEEVGTLAQTSGQAAREIQEMLSESQKRVEQSLLQIRERVTEGQRVSVEATSAFDEIATRIQGMDDQLSHIAEATVEHELGIKQTNLAMDKMERLAEHNSAVASRVADAATRLETQAARLFETSLANRVLVLGPRVALENGNNEVHDPIAAIIASALPTRDRARAVSHRSVEVVNARAADERASSPNGDAVRNGQRKLSELLQTGSGEPLADMGSSGDQVERDPWKGAA